MASGGGSNSAATGATGRNNSGGSGSRSDSGDAAPSVSTPTNRSTVVSTPALHSTPASESTMSAAALVSTPVTPTSKPPTSKKKRRGAGTNGSDKNGRGLRQFSMRVCDKVKSKGRTTYNEVADELVAEFSDPNINIDSPDPDSPSTQQYDEKNIRRRVYDALNVLEALEIISKDKKEIQWRGSPKTTKKHIQELKTEGIRLNSRIEKKNAYLQELEDQYECLQNMVRLNKQRHGSGGAPSSRLALPFTLVQTSPQAHVEVQMSEDNQLVDMDFNSTPFELHDECSVMNAMGLRGKEETDFMQAPVVNGGECSCTPNNFYPQSSEPLGPKKSQCTK